MISQALPIPIDTLGPIVGTERRIRLALGLTPEQVARSIWATPELVLDLEEGRPVPEEQAEEIRWSLAARLALRLWHVWGGGYRRGDGVQIRGGVGPVSVLWPRGFRGPDIESQPIDCRGPLVRRDVLLTMWAVQRAVPWSRPWREAFPTLCLECAPTGSPGFAWCSRCHGNGCDRCRCGYVSCPGCAGGAR